MTEPVTLDELARRCAEAWGYDALENDDRLCEQLKLSGLGELDNATIVLRSKVQFLLDDAWHAYDVVAGGSLNKT